jgi:hypothetical protein
MILRVETMRMERDRGRCGACHAAPYYTDNLMHDLKTERFLSAPHKDGNVAI